MACPKSLFLSQSNEWNTPISLYEKYNKTYNFVFDLACTSDNCLCKDGFKIDLGQDALTAEKWPKYGWCWLNPPYGRNLGKWVERAYYEWISETNIIMLIPARTDTSYWHKYIFPFAQIEFLKGRLHFTQITNSNSVKKESERKSDGRATFPSAIIRFGDPRPWSQQK